jgi:hypothetical protein
VEDYTQFAVGQRVDGEWIVDCPYCHRSAVRRAGDMIRFIHKIRIVDAGRKTLDLDSCPKENSHAKSA